MRVARLDDAAAAALQEARNGRLYLIARFQDVRDRSIVVGDGALDRLATTRRVGVGVQVFTAEGWCGFAATDDLSAGAVRLAVRRAGALARATGPSEPDASLAVFELPDEGRRMVPRRARRLTTGPEAEVAALVEANRALAAFAPDTAARASYAAVDEEWRIVRSDGTDVSFATPRAYARHELTVRSGHGVATAGATVSGADSDVLLDPAWAALLERRARRSLTRAQATLGTRPVRAGSTKLVIDYAIAKGLAHEAFGHACETDLARSSILATGGRLRLGEQIGPPGVSIVDGPIADDYADQPISANGLERRTVHLVRDGVLTSGLGDLFSAGRAASPMTGACRTGVYRRRPTPRMSNIRLVLAAPLPLRGSDPEDLEPEDVAAELRATGLHRRGEPLLYLAGYRGGQAHPVRGDFMFASATTYDLSDGVQPCQPAVFSGKSVAALRSIVAGLGPLRLDAMGICGKNGQNVSSSGGSHALVVLEAHPDVVAGSRG